MPVVAASTGATEETIIGSPLSSEFIIIRDAPAVAAAAAEELISLDSYAENEDVDVSLETVVVLVVFIFMVF